MPAHYQVLDIKERTKKTVKIATASTKGKGKNRDCRNGFPRSECMSQPPTIATPTIIRHHVNRTRGSLIVGASMDLTDKSRFYAARNRPASP